MDFNNDELLGTIYGNIREKERKMAMFVLIYEFYESTSSLHYHHLQSIIVNNENTLLMEACKIINT